MKNEEKLISVIVPVYNAEKHLNKCVDSIINQTYNNLEIILIDDGSLDSSSAICDEYLNKDKRIKVIHKKNEGVSSARNRGLDIASGDFISFVDSDDYLNVNMYMEIIKCFKENQVDIVVCNYNKMSGDKSEVGIKNNPIKEFDEEINKSIQGFLWNKIYKKEIIGQNRLDNKISMREDYVFNLYLCENNTPKYIFNEKALYNYQYIKNSLSHSRSFSRTTELDALEYIVNYYKKKKKDKYLYEYECIYIITFGLLKYRFSKSSLFSIKIDEYNNNIKTFIRKDKLLLKRIGLYNKLKIILILYLFPIYKVIKKITLKNAK